MSKSVTINFKSEDELRLVEAAAKLQGRSVSNYISQKLKQQRDSADNLLEISDLIGTIAHRELYIKKIRELKKEGKFNDLDAAQQIMYVLDGETGKLDKRIIK